jgi:hypothetical protein
MWTTGQLDKPMCGRALQFTLNKELEKLHIGAEK